MVKHFPYVVEGHGSVLDLPHGSELLSQVPSSIETLNWHRIEAHVLKSLLEARTLVCGCIAACTKSHKRSLARTYTKEKQKLNLFCLYIKPGKLEVWIPCHQCKLHTEQSDLLSLVSLLLFAPLSVSVV